MRMRDETRERLKRRGEQQLEAARRDFPVGSWVQVRHNEEDYRGFQGTVTGYSLNGIYECVVEVKLHTGVRQSDLDFYPYELQALKSAPAAPHPAPCGARIGMGYRCPTCEQES